MAAINGDQPPEARGQSAHVSPEPARAPPFDPRSRGHCVSEGGSATSLARGAAIDTGVRRSVAALTVAERKDFVDAVRALKRAPSPYDPSLSYYDQFVQWRLIAVCRTDA